MPDSAFRLVVVGLLFALLSYQADVLVQEVIFWMLGSAFTLFGFFSWIDERRQK